MSITVTFNATLIRFVTMLSLVCENKNNGDKLHRRKSMRAADEKLIINELGPYIGRKKFVDVPLNPKRHNVITVTDTDISLTSSVFTPSPQFLYASTCTKTHTAS